MENPERSSPSFGDGKAFRLRVFPSSSQMARNRNRNRRKTRYLGVRDVKFRRENRATSVVKEAPNIVLWDLDSLRIPLEYSRCVGDQIKAFIKRHGYTGEVTIEAFSGMRGPPWKRVSEAVISELRRPGSGVSHTRVKSKAREATDVVMKKRIDELIEQFEDTDTNDDEQDTETIKAANFFLMSSDAGFLKHMRKLNGKGHHTFLVYDNYSIDDGYLRSVTAPCKCIFKEFVSLP